MVSLADRRVSLAVDRLQNGLRPHDTKPMHQRALTLAKQIVAVKLDAESLQPFNAAKRFKATELDPTIRDVRRLRKIAEIVEDGFGVGVGHTRLVRVATTLSTFSSVGSIVLSGHNLVTTATALVKRYQKRGDLVKIDEHYYLTFYQALAIFVIDCMLFESPLDYKTAWIGTRYLNNRFLYKLRGISPSLYRYVLSEVHYAIRDIVPKMLTHPVAYTQYLFATTVNTFEIVWKIGQGDIALPQVPSVVKDLITEFQDFATSVYEFDPPAIEMGSLLSDILHHVQEIMGGSLSSP